MMTHFKSDFLHILHQRGFIHQSTDMETLDKQAAHETLTAYIGFDATAPSLHAGSLMQIMLLYWLQQTGHRPIVVMGGGTTKVGDPTGKDSQRKLLTDAEISANSAGIKRSFRSFLEFGEGAHQALMVNNDDWLSKVNYIEFLRDYGVHFTVNRMLSFDSVKLRLERESPMTFLEFNYMLMQAYDFLELNKRYGCTLQMGGSDQWGNIVNGVELCRRVAAATGTARGGVFGLTTPLLTTASGKKMGKTENGAIWVNEDMLSAYDYWQYWRNIEDQDVGRMLRFFTTMPIDEISRLEKLQGTEINEAKKILATEVTAMLHGRPKAQGAAATARKTFEEGVHADNLPYISRSASEFENGLPLLTLFKETGLIQSNSEGRRHLKVGALRINDIALTQERSLITEDIKGRSVKLSIGKKRHALVKIATD